MTESQSQRLLAECRKIVANQEAIMLQHPSDQSRELFIDAWEEIVKLVAEIDACLTTN